MLDAWADKPDAIPPEVRAEYVAKFADEATVHAICEEYRAAATLDLEHDRADRGTKKIRGRTLALWSKTGGVAMWPDPLQVWRNWCDDVTGEAFDCGHFLPEEAPDETARKLVEFLA
jgi:haloacetate dehalogenase